MISERQLALMKSSAYLLTMARGGVVDEGALYRCLGQKRLAGAALDVLENEPPREDHPLVGLDNVIFTPHVGGATREAAKRGEWGAAEEVVRVLEGKSPRNPVIRLHR